jgi:thioredoxin reductase
VTDDRLTGVRLAGGRVVATTALVVATRMVARSGLLAGLGLETAELRVGDHVVGRYVPADPMGATAVPGVWVAGNVADLQAQVGAAAAGGARAAAGVNADLVTADVRIAVAGRRGPFDPAAERQVAARVPAHRGHVV